MKTRHILLIIAMSFIFLFGWAIGNNACAAHDGEVLFRVLAEKAAKGMQTPEVKEKKVEPFMINGLFIGQKYKAAKQIMTDEIHTSAWENGYTPKFVETMLRFLMRDYRFLFNYDCKKFVWTGWNFVMIDQKTDKVLLIFLGGADATINYPELIPETKDDEIPDFDKFVANWMNLNDIKVIPKRGFLPNNPWKSAYWELDDCMVFLFPNFTIQVMGKTPELMKSISPVPVNKNRPIKKQKQVNYEKL